MDVEPIANELRGIGTLLRALAIIAEGMSIAHDALAVLSELVHGHTDVLAAIVDEPPPATEARWRHADRAFVPASAFTGY